MIIDSPTSESTTQFGTAGRLVSTVGFPCLALLPIGLAGIACVIRPDLLAALILIPPWFWVLAGFPGIVWAVRSGRRRWTIGLASVWAAFVFGYVEEFSSLTRAAIQSVRATDRRENRIRVVSLNFANTVRCLEDLQAAKPDIALIQEIPSDQELQQMARTLFGEEGKVLAGHDTAILARGPIISIESEVRRTIVAGIVTIPGHRPIHCLSARRTPPVFRMDGWSPGFWSEHRARRETHRREALEIREALDAIAADIPRIAGGDLNAPPLDPTLEILQPSVQDAFLSGGVGWGGTGTNDFPLFRVDQIWTSIPVVQVFSQKTKHSDHRMVVCDLLLTE